MVFVPGSPEYLALQANVAAGLGPGQLAAAKLMAITLDRETIVAKTGADATAVLTAYVDTELVASGQTGELVGRAKEDYLVTAHAGTLYSYSQTMLTQDPANPLNVGMAARLVYNPVVDSHVNIALAESTSLPEIDPDKLALGEVFVRAKARADSKGIPVPHPRVGANGRSVKGALARVTSSLAITSVIGSTAGATFTYARGVEWEVAPKAGPADFKYFPIVSYDGLGRQALTLTDDRRDFSQVVAGDVVEVTARLGAPITRDRDLAGFYRVIDKTEFSLRLDPEKLWRLGDGLYTPGALPPTANFDDTMDYRVLRTASNVFAIKTSLDTQGVQIGDWAHLSYLEGTTPRVRIFKISGVQPGLILLTGQYYTESPPPFVMAGTMSFSYFESAATFSVERVPDAVSSLTLYDPTGDFAAVKPGDFVTLTQRVAALDATMQPFVVCHTFLVKSALDRHTLDLDPTYYQLVGGLYVAAGAMRKALTDFVGYSTSFYVTTFPNTGLYKVFSVDVFPSDTKTRSMRLEAVLYGPDDAFDGSLPNRVNVATAFIDKFDLELIYLYGDRLFVFDPTGDFSKARTYDAAFVANTTDLVHTSTGVFRIQDLPRKDVAFLHRAVGRLSPPYTFTGSYQPASGGSATIYSLTRIQDVFTSLILRGTFPLASVGQYLTLDTPTAAVPGLEAFAKLTLKIASVSAGQLTLDNALAYGTDGTIVPGYGFPYAALGNFGLQAPCPVTFSLHAQPTGVTRVVLDYAPYEVHDATGTSVFGRTQKLANPAAAPAGPLHDTDIVYFIYEENGALVTLKLIPTGITPTGGLLLYGHAAVGEANGGVYTVAPAPFLPAASATGGVVFDKTGRVTIKRPHFGRDRAAVVVATLETLLPENQVASVQAIFNAIVPARYLDPANLAADGKSLLGAARGAIAGLASAGSGVVHYPLPLEEIPWRVTALDDTAKALGDALTTAELTTVGTSPWPFIGQRVEMRRALSLLASSSLITEFTKKTLSELKDLYIDARLQYEGYVDLSVYLATTVGVVAPASVLEPQLADARTHALVARKIMAAALFVTGQRRPDLVDSYETQYQNILGIVKDAWPPLYASETPVTPPNPYMGMRFFVQSGTVALNDSLAQQVAFLRVPFTNTPLIPGDTLATLANANKDPNPKPRRVGFVGMIGVPADRTLRAKQRSYLLEKNRSKSLGSTIDDLIRHRDTATSPDIAAKLGDWIDQTTGKKALADMEAGTLEAQITEQGGEAPETPNNPSPEDTMATSDDAAPYMSSDLEPSGVGEQFVSTSASVVTSNVVPGAAPAIGLGERQEDRSKFEGIITNLFTEDFNDFKRTGIAMSLNVYDQGPYVRTNKQRLASIYIADYKGTPVTGAAGQFNLPGPWGSGTFKGSRYNHFILTGMQELHQEKQMVMDTLGRGWVGLMFGSAPEVWSVSGILINDTYSDQLTKFRDLWESQIRGTQLARNHVKMALDIPAAGVVIVGYPISLQMTIDAAQNETVVPFTMQILVSVKRPRPLYKEVIAQEKAVATALTKRDGTGYSSSLKQAAANASNAPSRSMYASAIGPLPDGSNLADAVQAAGAQIEGVIQGATDAATSAASQATSSIGRVGALLSGREAADDNGTPAPDAGEFGLSSDQTDGAYPTMQMPFAARGNLLDPSERAPEPVPFALLNQPGGLPGLFEPFPNQPPLSALEQ